MIAQIEKIHFPDEAIITQATVNLNDMGEKTIDIQIKVDGRLTPDFRQDWEIMFQGERYIHPLREPQASKGNESICSTIDLTFQHWTIYQLKRYYFVEMASTKSGIAIVDKYNASLGVNLKGFCEAFNSVLEHYFKEESEIRLILNNPNSYSIEPQYIEINYTHLWDVLQKMYDIYGVRWVIKGNEIIVGAESEEIDHLFQYGFEGGLLKVERQMQSNDIRNSLLGRGGDKNLPYRYFKNVDKNNPSFNADPDWIPELASISFAELRGKTFRDYIQGWKTNPMRDLLDGELSLDPYDEERAKIDLVYTKGHTDDKFDPVEYVKDEESIEKYGLFQGGLDNQEDIYPSIQGVEVDGIGRVDEVVGVERVTIDEVSIEDIANENAHISIEPTFRETKVSANNKNLQYTFYSDEFVIPRGCKGGFLNDLYLFCHYETIQHKKFKQEGGLGIEHNSSSPYSKELKMQVFVKVLDNNNEELLDIANLPDNTPLRVRFDVEVEGKFPETTYDYDRDPMGNTSVTITTYDSVGDITIYGGWTCTYMTLNGLILGNYTNGTNRIYETIKLEKNKKGNVTLISNEFDVPEHGATNIDVPINIIASASAQGLYEWRKISVDAVNVATNEVVSSINIPQGRYYLRVEVEIQNLASQTQTYKVELMPSYIYYKSNVETFQPTFKIWVKNIWNTTRLEGESETSYVHRVWDSILGDREGNTPKVVFSTGMLSSHSDWEFEIVKGGITYAGDKGIKSDSGIPAEWCLTLAKSTAELEATGKYIPSTEIQASKGDYFYFIGIDMPHEYVLWAERRLDDYKRDQLKETAYIKPTWAVQIDKVRLNQLQPNETEPLLNALKVGNKVRLWDSRFLEGEEQLYIQSISYSWQTGTILLPDVEIVLSDKVATVTNAISQIKGEVDAISKQVGSISNVQQVVRAIGDKLYLRKDGLSQVSNSQTTFNKSLESLGFRQGAVGGLGWGLRTEQGKGILEVDKLVVRDDMRVNSLVVNQVEHVGGLQVLSAANITCTKVEYTNDGIVCYFDQKQGSIANLFVVNDIAYSQVYNSTNNKVKYYKRIVTAITSNSITLSYDSDGDGAPQVGDVIVQYGNVDSDNHADRQYVIIRDVIGGGYERMLCGLNSVNAVGEEYYFAGRLNGDTPRWFVGDENQFIEYKDGHLKVQADVTLGKNSSGLAEMQEFQNAMSQTQSYIDKAIEGLQDQLDGKVESYFYPYDPSFDLEPTSEWVTREEMDAHINDTFTNIHTGESWRWVYLDGDYQWMPIDDTKALEALNKAQEALDLANNKVAVFVEEPRSPYNVGDLWLQGEGGNIMRCRQARTTKGEYHPDDWVNADDYKAYVNSQIHYLKEAFPEGVVLDVNGVTLSSLMGVTDESGNVVAGIYGGKSDTLNDNGYKDSNDGALMLFAGAKNAQDVPNAAFRVYESGKLVAKDAEIEGKVRATEGELENVMVKGTIRSPFGKNVTGDTVNTTDNFTLHSLFSPFYLPCDNAQSGRKLTLVGSGDLKLDWPETNPIVNFYEGGIKLKSISLNSEVIELIGYENEGIFAGWIVLNRTPYTRSYPQGRNLNPIIFGRAKYRSNTLTQECYACDGTHLQIERVKAGTYKLVIPNTLIDNIDNLVVNCTSTPTDEYSDYPVIVVANKSISSNTIEFRMYRTDGNRMDGAFDFMIYPLKAWK